MLWKFNQFSNLNSFRRDVYQLEFRLVRTFKYNGHVNYISLFELTPDL